MMLRVWVFVCAAAAVAIVGGCGTYEVKGRVVRGPASAVEFVSADDPRLNDTGVPSANIDVIRDPKSLGRETVAALRSGADGGFVLRIDDATAGWLEEDWRIRCYATGFANADQLLPLSRGGADVRLLITLSPGYSEAPVESEMWNDFEEFR